MDTLKIEKNISESKAFKNCIEILENFELEQKPFEFTENYIKWLLNKFQMPFVFLEPFEDIPPDEKPENIVAFAIEEENLISVPIKDLNYTNLAKSLGYIAHEIKHLSDQEFYINNLILGKDRNLYQPSFQDNNWKNSKIDDINSESLIRSVAYYLNSHEVGARECEYFYSNLFLRLALGVTNNNHLKKIINLQIKDCIKKSAFIDEHSNALRVYSTLTIYKKELKQINKFTYTIYKKYLNMLKHQEIKGLYDVENQLSSLISLYPNKAIGKKLAKLLFSKKYAFTSSCLEMLALMPYEILTECEINNYIINKNQISENLLKSIEPTTLAERFLILHGSKSLLINSSEFLNSYALQIKKIKEVSKRFANYTIKGLCNMPNSIKKHHAIAKFMKTKNFKLTNQMLDNLNTVFNGEFCIKHNENLPIDKEKIN